MLLTVPNLPVPPSPRERAPKRTWRRRQEASFPNSPPTLCPIGTWAKKYNIIDFETGVKVTGAGFPFYIGKGARLQRALIQFFLDEAWKAGYTEVEPPFVVNEASGYGTGQLPDKEGQMYHADSR